MHIGVALFGDSLPRRPSVALHPSGKHSAEPLQLIMSHHSSSLATSALLSALELKAQIPTCMMSEWLASSSVKAQAQLLLSLLSASGRYFQLSEHLSEAGELRGPEKARELKAGVRE